MRHLTSNNGKELLEILIEVVLYRLEGKQQLLRIMCKGSRIGEQFIFLIHLCVLITIHDKGVKPGLGGVVI